MRTRRFREGLLAASVLAAAAGPGWAGGWAVPEQGTRALGLGGASVAFGQRATAVTENVAGLAFLERPDLVVGGSFVLRSTSFEGVEPFPGASASEDQDPSLHLPPSIDYAQPLGRSVVLGLGVHSPFALLSRWTNPSTFSGRFIAQSTDLRCYTLTPGIGLRLADRLAIGASLDVHLANMTFERRVPYINPYTGRVVDGAAIASKSKTKAAVGFGAGLLAKASEDLAFGVTYRHRARIDFRGDATIARMTTGQPELDARLANVFPPTPLGFELSLPLPSTLTGGVAYTWSDWTLTADAVLTRWGSAPTSEWLIAGRPELTSTLATQLENTVRFRAGFERRVNHSWTARAGYFREASPLTPERVGPVLVDSDQQGFTLGGTWQRRSLRLDFAPGVALFKRHSTAGANREGFNGIYTSFKVFCGASLGVGF